MRRAALQHVAVIWALTCSASLFAFEIPVCVSGDWGHAVSRLRCSTGPTGLEFITADDYQTLVDAENTTHFIPGCPDHWTFIENSDPSGTGLYQCTMSVGYDPVEITVANLLDESWLETNSGLYIATCLGELSIWELPAVDNRPLCDTYSNTSEILVGDFAASYVSASSSSSSSSSSSTTSSSGGVAYNGPSAEQVHYYFETGIKFILGLTASIIGALIALWVFHLIMAWINKLISGALD